MGKYLAILLALMCPLSVNALNPDDNVPQDTLVLNEVVVTGSRVKISREEMPNPISIVRREIFENRPEAQIMPVLSKRVPGLFVTTRGVSGYGVSTGSAGGINLRGFSGSNGRVLILIDGHPQYSGIYGHPVADSYISQDADRVEVFRGPASVLYGSNAMGGAINIVTRKATQNGNHFHFKAVGGSYGTQKYTLSDSYKKDAFTAFAGATYERNDGHRPRSAFKSVDGYVKLGYEVSDNWKLSTNVSLNNFNAENPGDEVAPMLDSWADVIRGMSAISLENDYGKTSGSVNLYYNWGINDINDGYTLGGNPQPYLFHSTDYSSGVNAYQSLHFFEGNTVTAGVDVNIYGGNAFRDPITEYYADHIRLTDIAGYLFLQQKLGRFDFNTGLRLDNHELYGNEWIPQFGVTYNSLGNTTMKASVSKGFRTPTLKELYMFVSANEDLLPESALEYDFTLEQKLLDNHLVLELNLYYVEGDNIIQVVKPVGAMPRNQNVGEFANKGVEFSATWYALNNLSFNGNYSYLHMDTPITGSPENKYFFEVLYRPGKFSLEANIENISGLYLQTGADSVKESYALLGARVAYKASHSVEFFVNGENLTARKYQTMLGYPMPGATFMGGISLNL